LNETSDVSSKARTAVTAIHDIKQPQLMGYRDESTDKKKIHKN